MDIKINNRSDFVNKIINSTSPCLIIFFDNNSDMLRVKRYKDIIEKDFSSVICYRINLDDNILNTNEIDNYVKTSLICCTAICNSIIRCESNPDQNNFKNLLRWLNN